MHVSYMKYFMELIIPLNIIMHPHRRLGGEIVNDICPEGLEG